MPALTPITLNGVNGADHVFKPFGTDPQGVATFRKAGSTPVADESLTMSLRKTPQGKYRWLMKIDVPKVQDVTINGVTKPSVIKRGVVTLDITTESTHSAEERGELLDLVRSALTDADNAGAGTSLVFNEPWW
jgi:hypothetical protein